MPTHDHLLPAYKFPAHVKAREQREEAAVEEFVAKHREHLLDKIEERLKAGEDNAELQCDYDTHEYVIRVRIGEALCKIGEQVMAAAGYSALFTFEDKCRGCVINGSWRTASEDHNRRPARHWLERFWGWWMAGGTGY